MKVFVAGSTGQLGYDVVNELQKRNYSYLGVGSKDLDITDRNKVINTITKYNPDAVIHCAAYTKVDDAEDNIDLCFSINRDGTQNIADACKQIDCKMVYISTDYVFGDDSDIPHKPDDKNFNPLNVYGKSKLEGEFAVANTLTKSFIVRTSWVYGEHGNNFVKTMLKLSETHDEVRVVNDQIGNPTYTPDLARLLVDMIETDKYGYYHATNSGDYISWADFAREIFKQANRSTKVVPVTTEEYGLSKAKRPKNSRLDKTKLTQNGFKILNDYNDSIGKFLSDKEKIDVSVVITTYNCNWETLKMTLNSALFQKNIEFEIIITDDGSKDNNFQNLENYFKRNNFNNYKLISHKENMGTVKNFLDGVTNASGKYIRGLGQGDFFYDENTLKNSFDFAVINNSDVIVSKAVFYEANKIPLKIIEHRRYPQLISSYSDISKLKISYLLYGDNVSGATIFYKKDLLIKYLNSIISKVKYAEDFIMYLYILDGRKINFYNRNTVLYEYGEGISTKKDSPFSKLMRNDWESFCKMLIHICGERNDEFSKKVKNVFQIKEKSFFKRNIYLAFHVNGYLKFKIKSKFFTAITETKYDKEFINRCINE